MDKFEILGKRLEHHGAIVDFYTYEMGVPNGNRAEWDVIEHKGAAAVLPVDAEGKILLVRQYRGAIDELLLEIPAGGRDGMDEDYAVCAARELEEETGYRTDELYPLIVYHSAPAYTSEKIAVYYTEKLIQSSQNLDENEYVQVVRYTPEELKEMIFCGSITDGKTIAAVLAYCALKKK